MTSQQNQTASNKATLMRVLSPEAAPLPNLHARLLSDTESETLPPEVLQSYTTYQFEKNYTISVVSESCTTITKNYHLLAFIAILPAFMRFSQCLRRYYDSGKIFPHIVNGGKYATGISNILVHYLLPDYVWLLIFFSLANSFYTIYWDLRQDWGFFENNVEVEHKYLREELVYSDIWVYYAAIIQNVILRMKWAFFVYLRLFEKLILDNKKVIFIFKTISQILEIYRRFCWNFFRLENEHLNNCGEFRAVRDISIAPVKDDDIVKLERMMDKQFGVKNRKPLKTSGLDLKSRKLMQINMNLKQEKLNVDKAPNLTSSQTVSWSISPAKKKSSRNDSIFDKFKGFSGKDKSNNHHHTSKFGDEMETTNLMYVNVKDEDDETGGIQF